MEDCPPFPPPNAARNVREVYKKWTQANKKAQAYIFASLNDVLDKKHEPMIIAHKIMESLRGMFGQPSMQLRHDAMKFIFNSMMKKGTSIRQHVLNKMIHFNVVKMNGSSIDEGQPG
ncbi:uncharacterized protein LOC120078020 [Benincasa hispida]|uniref:uncharacterized protein LOC120078020 n=1 Tax=Benincasa hispida TaxID=102211 RepID=UPI0018FF32DB|nr:uncharacterized protein LOC120078020 [Benincasa hispida]